MAVNKRCFLSPVGWWHSSHVYAAAELAARIDLTLANLSIRKTGKARAIRFSTLEAICGALGCQPGDILEFVPESISGSEQLRNTS